MEVTKTNSVELFNIKVLIYGPPGSGKTYRALTLDPKKTLVISAEAGLLPLAGVEMDVIKLRDWGDIKPVYMELLKPETQKKYRNVFIDSLTEINEMGKEQIVKKDRPAIKTNQGQVYDDLMTLQDWGLLLTRMTRLIRSFRDLPYNIIITALEDVHKDEQAGTISYVPSINGKLAVNIGGYFDEVFRLVTKEADDEIHRQFITGKTERSIAKDRSGVLALYEEPHLGKIFRKIIKKFSVEEKTK